MQHHVDAAAAYAFATARYPAERIVLWGESLGCALALALAAEKPVGRLVLEAPFTSAADVGAQHYRFVPVRLFMKDQFRSDLRIGKVTAPVLVVHGEDDTIVPVTLGERLYGLIRAPKRFVRIAGAGHNDLGAQAVATAARKRSRYGHRDATMILVACRHGLRASEVCGLRWDQIDLNSGRLHVRRAKGGNWQATEISPQVQRKLRKFQTGSSARCAIQNSKFV